MNLEKINIIKREKINKIISFIEETNKDQIIDKVIIFGSSVTNECTKDSDIDICLFTQYNCFNPTFFNIYGKIPLIASDL